MLIIFFGLGLIVGSFLNAVIFRLHSGESFVSSRSHCMHCGHELAPKDLVPVFSFLFLRGRCRYCKAKISWQYIIVELLTGIAFALAYYNLQPITYNLVWQLVFICFLIVIAVFDFKHYLILDKVVFPASILALLYSIYAHHFFSSILGIALISGFFYLQYFTSRGRWIGLGDVKFGIFLGSLLGFKLSLALLVFAYTLGALVGVGLIALGYKKLSSRLPFGTFLGFSAIIILLYGSTLVNWYLGLIGL